MAVRFPTQVILVVNCISNEKNNKHEASLLLGHERGRNIGVVCCPVGFACLLSAPWFCQTLSQLLGPGTVVVWVARPRVDWGYETNGTPNLLTDEDSTQACRQHSCWIHKTQFWVFKLMAHGCRWVSSSMQSTTEKSWDRIEQWRALEQTMWLLLLDWGPLDYAKSDNTFLRTHMSFSFKSHNLMKTVEGLYMSEPSNLEGSSPWGKWPWKQLRSSRVEVILKHAKVPSVLFKFVMGAGRGKGMWWSSLDRFSGFNNTERAVGPLCHRHSFGFLTNLTVCNVSGWNPSGKALKPNWSKQYSNLSSRMLPALPTSIPRLCLLRIVSSSQISSSHTVSAGGLTSERLKSPWSNLSDLSARLVTSNVRRRRHVYNIVAMNRLLRECNQRQGDCLLNHPVSRRTRVRAFPWVNAKNGHTELKKSKAVKQEIDQSKDQHLVIQYASVLLTDDQLENSSRFRVLQMCLPLHNLRRAAGD